MFGRGPSRWALAHILVDSVGGFLGQAIQLSNEGMAEIEGLRDVAMATNFGTEIAITGFV